MNPWLFTYEGFDPEAGGRREVICTLANGYLATRSALPEAVADDIHYPGSYVAGVFNRLTTDLSGHPVENESLVNSPTGCR